VVSQGIKCNVALWALKSCAADSLPPLMLVVLVSVVFAVSCFTPAQQNSTIIHATQCLPLPTYYFTPARYIFHCSPKSCFLKSCDGTDVSIDLSQLQNDNVCQSCSGEFVNESAAALFEVVRSCWAERIGVIIMPLWGLLLWRETIIIL